MESAASQSAEYDSRYRRMLACSLGLSLVLTGCGLKQDIETPEQSFAPATYVGPLPIELTIPEPAPLPPPVPTPQPVLIETPPAPLEIKASLRPPSNRLEEFVDRYYDLAARVEMEFGVPRDLTLAQAIHESDYGRSGLTQQANNFFGIKAHHVGFASWQGPVFGTPTWEVVSEADLPKYRVITQTKRADGKYDIQIVDGFRQYGSAEESFFDYGNYLANRGINAPGEYYADAHGLNDPAAYLKEILDDDDGPDGPQKSYATDPAYLAKLIPYIQKIQAARAALGRP